MEEQQQVCFAYQVLPDGTANCKALKEMACTGCAFYKSEEALYRQRVRCCRRLKRQRMLGHFESYYRDLLQKERQGGERRYGR